jgi:hypothetical protein
MIKASAPSKNNVSTTLAMPTPSSLDAPTADEEPGSRNYLHRFLHQLNRNSQHYYFLLIVLVTLYYLPSVSATPTSTVDVAVRSEGWTSLIKRATSDSASAATCACSATSEGNKHDAAFIVKVSRSLSISTDRQPSNLISYRHATRVFPIGMLDPRPRRTLWCCRWIDHR